MGGPEDALTADALLAAQCIVTVAVLLLVSRDRELSTNKPASVVSQHRTTCNLASPTAFPKRPKKIPLLSSNPLLWGALTPDVGL